MKRVYSLLVFLSVLTVYLSAYENHAVVLQYHRFNESKYPSTSVSTELFEKQLSYLAQNHYTVWPLSKIIRYLQQDKEVPERTVAITIDDAYKSSYTEAFSLLKKYDFPFTLFVSSMPVEHHSKNYLTWDEMREMGAHGAEFANHSYSHPYLVRQKMKTSDAYEAYVKKEVQRCEQKLQQELGHFFVTEPRMFAYPFGEYDEKLMQIVQKLGYVGVAQNSGPIGSKSNFMALTRFPMSGGFGEMEQFTLKIDTLPLSLKSVEREDTLVDQSNNPPTLTLTLQKTLKALQCFMADGKKIETEWKNDTTVTMQAKEPLLYPRNHYTCTAPAEDGRWYWYSHLWVILK